MEYTTQERAIMAQIEPSLLPALKQTLKAFYDWVDTVPHLRTILRTSNRSSDELADLQLKHWQVLIKNGPTEEFQAQATRIGQIHYRIGLTAEWYLSGYSFVFENISKFLGKRYAKNGGDAARVLSILNKLMMVDMQYSLLAYSQTASLQEAERTSQNFANGVVDSAIHVSMSINEAAIASVRMQHAMEVADQEAQSISAAVEETVVGINQIAETTQQVSEFAHEAEEFAKNSAKEVIEAQSQMQGIAKFAQETADILNRLEETSRSISDMVITIDAIANQTNLLALNATIEAARAGDAGKGFAVVATEVKSLSEQTGKATEEIRTRVDGLLSEMDSILSAMDSTNASVNTGMNVMDRMAEAMKSLGENVSAVSTRMIEVSHILQEQTAASNEVSSGVSQIAESSTTNVESLKSVNHSITNVTSEIGQQLAEFMKYDIPNKIIRIAKSDHVIWKKRLADMLAGQQTLSVSELSDHHSCRLGNFYYGAEAEKYKDLPAFKALEDPHERVHKWGIKAVELYNNKDIKGAMAAMTEVEKASEEVLELLNQTLLEANQSSEMKLAAE